MKKYLISILFFQWLLVISQPCATRPYSASWDWKEDVPYPHKYTAHIKKNLVSNSVDLLSPFYDGTNSNTLNFALENITRLSTRKLYVLQMQEKLAKLEEKLAEK